MLIDSCVVDIFHFFPLYNKNFLITKDNRFGFFGQKDNRGPPSPPPPSFLQKLSIWRDWPRDLKFGMWHPSTFLSSGKIRNPPRTPPSLSFLIFAKNRKNFISRFSARRSRKKVWYHKIKIVGKVHIWLTRKNFSPIGWRV